MKIALCVGHSRQVNNKTEGGAVSVGKVQEWAYNYSIAQLVRDRLSRHEVLLVAKYQGEGYGSAMRWLADHLKDEQVDVATEFHFNSSSPIANGHEWLHWHSSSKGKDLATNFDKTFRAAFPKLKARGVKPLNSANRGSEFLKLTHCPSVILEPFFGSNVDDWEFAVSHKKQIADAYAQALDTFSKS